MGANITRRAVVKKRRRQSCVAAYLRGTNARGVRALEVKAALRLPRREPISSARCGDAELGRAKRRPGVINNRNRLTRGWYRCLQIHPRLRKQLRLHDHIMLADGIPADRKRHPVER